MLHARTRSCARSRGCATACAALALLGAAPLAAAASSSGPRRTIKEASRDLDASDLNRAIEAARRLGATKHPAALRSLLARLEVGAPPELAVQVLAGLADRKPVQVITILRHYAAHRNPKVRIAALRALGTLRHPVATAVLLAALGDSRAEVRALAARLLGRTRQRSAEARLLALVKRGDLLASGPLGQVASAEGAKRLAQLIGEIPVEAVATAFGEMLKRRDFGPDPLRVQVVKALGKLQGIEITAALAEYVASVPPEEDRVSKRLAEQILARESH